MITRRFALGLIGEAAPGGRYAVLVDNQHVETDAGNVALPGGENVLYLRALWRHGTRWLAGGGHQTDRAWLHDGVTWLTVGSAYGVNPCAFKPDAVLWCYGGHGCMRRPLDGGPAFIFPLASGSQGIRWVRPDGVIVTADSTYADLSRGLYQFTDYGDVVIGEGADESGGGCVARFADDGILRRIEPGQVRFVRAQRVGDEVAIAMTRQDTREVVVVWTTLAEMRQWPPVVAPPNPPSPPQPPPPPDPELPPPPEEIPMPEPTKLVSPSGQYEVTIHDDGNLVVYARGGRPVWASGADPHPGPTPDPDPDPLPDCPA